MINREYVFPFYVKASIFLLGFFALIYGLYIGQSIFIPIIFAGIIAILLNPIVRLLTRIKINRTVAILITLTLTLLILAALGTLLYKQLSKFSESWPILVEKITLIMDQGVSWASRYFDINPHIANEWILNSKDELINSSGMAIGQTILSIGNTIFILILIPVYVFMILFYEPLLLDFIHKLFGVDNQSQVGEIITQTKSVIQRYLVGLVIEAVIIAALSTIGLLILGIEYAILLGIVGALLNIIPYIGGIVGAAIPMIIAFITKDSAWYAIYVMGIFYFIQLIDNNYIVPKIVASKVKINALFSVIVVIVGNAIWGVSGMFLSIPLLAIVKLIFDHIEPLKPWGFLLGDTMPSILDIKKLRKKKVVTV